MTNPFIQKQKLLREEVGGILLNNRTDIWGLNILVVPSNAHYSSACV